MSPIGGLFFFIIYGCDKYSSSIWQSFCSSSSINFSIATASVANSNLTLSLGEQVADAANPWDSGLSLISYSPVSLFNSGVALLPEEASRLR